jgi:GWxTD domain-containing protein
MLAGGMRVERKVEGQRGRQVGLLAALVLAATTAATGVEKAERGGEKAESEKAEREWLRQVRLLLLPAEEELFRQLSDPGDRREFQRIFWARRDPTPGTPANEWQDAVKKAWARGDSLFEQPGTPGSKTGCGQVLALLGEPTEVEGRELRTRFDLRDTREGARRPERWIYKSRPGGPVSFTGGELRLDFDEACRFPEGGQVLEDLRRVAASCVVQPGLEYRRTADGHLVRLEDLLRSSSAVASLLGSGRSDFVLAAEPKLLLRTPAGAAYAAGLLRMEPGASPSVGGGAAAPKVRVAAQAIDAAGQAGAPRERTLTPLVESAGTWLVSYGLPVKAGSQTLRLAAELPDGKASVTTLPLEVPDFDAPGLKLGPLLVYPDAEGAPAPEAQGPYSAFALGSLRVEPRFGNVFTTKDALQVVALVYGGALDPATGKASLRARFSILKAGEAVAKGADQVFETPSVAPSVGPIPLAGFAPGQYIVRLQVTDAHGSKTETREVGFEVRE